MVQPELMTALKPESVGRPLGVATMTPTADNEENGYTNNIDNSSLHTGANWAGRAKSGDAAPAPTLMARKKRVSQTILLSQDINKKARQTHISQTRDTLLGRDSSDKYQSRVTSKSDMNFTPQKREYMRSSLQRSCYMERHSGEGGSTSILNPLALTYHFGRASATPDRKEPPRSPGTRPNLPSNTTL